MCFVNSLIGTNAELNIHMRTNAIAHKLGSILKLVRTFDIEIVISMKFSDFWLPPITCQHQNEKKTFSNIDPSRLVAIFSPSPRPHLVFYFSDVFVFFSISLRFRLFGCLLSLSSICSRSIHICNNKWLLDLQRKKVNCPSLLTQCITMAVANNIRSKRKPTTTKMLKLEIKNDFKKAHQNKLNCVEQIEKSSNRFERYTNKQMHACKRRIRNRQWTKTKMNICYLLKSLYRNPKITDT